jgi:hypothetical protein
MNTKAIERIKDYCCEVTKEQWEELVRVADEVGCEVGTSSKRDGPCSVFRLVGEYKGALSLYRTASGKEIIPFPDFLAKLKGEEDADPFTASETLEMARKTWQPKAGEMVEVNVPMTKDGSTTEAKFIGMDGKAYVVRLGGVYYGYRHIRPILPTITRAEAEKQLGKRIID